MTITEVPTHQHEPLEATPMRKRQTVSRIATGLAATVALLAMAISVNAAGPEAPKLGIRLLDSSTAYVNLTMRPGETKVVRLELGNYGTTPATARSYVADVYSMINGGMGVGLSGEVTSGTTSWLTFPAKTVELEARQAVPETLTINVPSAAAPGDYISAVVIEGDAPTSQSGDATFNQVDRQAVAIAIRVPGPLVPGLSLPTAALRTTPGGVSYIDLGVVNSGNTHLHLAGSYALTDAGGAQIAGGGVAMDTVYAGSRTVLAVPLEVRLAPGHYIVNLSLSDPTAPITASSGPLPLDIGAEVAAPPAPATTGLDLAPLVAAVLALGLALGVAVASGASIVFRRNRRPASEGSPAGS